MITKTALIFGTRIGVAQHKNVPEENRPHFYKMLNTTKALEPNSEWGTVLPTGAAIGSAVSGTGAYLWDRLKDQSAKSTESGKSTGQAISDVASDGSKKLSKVILKRLGRASKILGTGAMAGVALSGYLKLRDDDIIEKARLGVLDGLNNQSQQGQFYND